METINQFRSKNLLVTGGAGFIGSNFIKYLFEKYQDLKIFNLDLLTYAGSEENTVSFINKKNYKFIHGDICNYNLVDEIFKKYSIDGVINFAAESHVDNSIKFPDIFINTNVNGTFNLLKCCFNNWMISPGLFKKGFEKARFHQVSTDEVYGSITNGSFDEKSTYNPNSPYSASKASADLLVRSFTKTYSLDSTISVCSNNYGPNQNQEKLLPKLLSFLKSGKRFPLYGKGENIRDWIHVDDHCNAIDLIFNFSEIGEKFNIASGQEYSNIQIINYLNSIAKLKLNFDYVVDRFGHDFRYSVKTDKIKNQLNWKPKSNILDYLKNQILQLQ